MADACDGRIELIGGPMFSGKCHAKGTRILMFDESCRAVEDIVRGDKLMGDDCYERTAMSTSSGYGPLFTVIQSHANDYVVNGDHVLALFRTDGVLVDMSVREFMYLPDETKGKYRGYTRLAGGRAFGKLSTLTIESCGSGEYFGFTIDGNHRYRLEDHTVTHNTTELLRRLFCDASVHRKILYINHAADVRTMEPYSTHNPLYKNHFGAMTDVTMVSCSSLPPVTDIMEYDTIGVDESQFFDDLSLVLEYADAGKKVVVAGLVSDSNRKKFGHITDLIPAAEDYVSLHALCVKCAEHGRLNNASFTYKFVTTADAVGDGPVDVGGSDKYIPVCRDHYLKCSQTT